MLFHWHFCPLRHIRFQLQKSITSGFGLPKPGGVPGGDIKPHRATPGLGRRKLARLRHPFKIGTSGRELTKAGRSDISEAAVSVTARWSRRFHSRFKNR